LLQKTGWLPTGLTKSPRKHFGRLAASSLLAILRNARQLSGNKKNVLHSISAYHFFI
jgi:hypothetical protein